MNSFKLFSVAMLLTVIIAIASAASPVGTWNGKIVVDMSSLPKTTTPQQRQRVAAGMDMIKKMKIVITLKADHTYTATAVGGPGGAKQTDSGTWSQSGNKVSITPKRKSQASKAEVLTMSSDGKTMSMSFPAGAMKGKVLFTR